MQVLKRIVASLAIAAVLGCFGISAPAYAEDTIDSSNQLSNRQMQANT